MRKPRLTSLAALLIAGVTFPVTVHADVSDEEFNAVKARLAELEAKEDQNWLNDQRTAQIKAIVAGVLADARQHESVPNVGYNNGFYIQSPDGNFKLSIGGVLQVRYEFALHHAANSQFSTKPLTQGSEENASGFDIRRARLSFSGNAFSRDLFYRFEGDFAGSSTGGFTVIDAYAGYAFSPQLKVRAGAFKVPFTKSEQEYDANLELERPEVNFPFDPQRALGVSLFGDLLPDKWGYEINANDGSKTNTFRYVDTYSNVTAITSSTTPAYNLDNRLAFYARTQYAGSGKISDFYEGGEADLRHDNRDFIWLLGGAVGYESQNSSAAAFPQSTAAIVGLGSNDAPGFIKAYVLNGDLYRATLDWSAKWQGWSFNTAAYFQQVNANPYAGTTSKGLPYNTSKASFFQQGYYAQVGYMLLPPHLQLVGRVGYLLDEGDPNIGQFYTVGANYYFFGNNVKLTGDVTFTPEAAYTDASTLQILNTSQLTLRVQFQLKF